MKIVLQRVTNASVSVEGRIISSIGVGVLLLIGFGPDDEESKLRPTIEKILQLRIFPDGQGRFDRSLLDIKGEVLAVSQFTLYADTSKGRRPGFSDAMPPGEAEPLYNKFLEVLREANGGRVGQGEFGAHMHVELENDGPVTILFES